ncbi:hypothetical protein EB796_024827 [Bugula neritina]|uniref:Uncharacterized protein n=1 Tax=Bugula neritina TaxID=10212 RepID=A0A7J7ITZ7_BUGNE|nr:hypothetical protein EB796_024827 [Bugula neritina]
MCYSCLDKFNSKKSLSQWYNAINYKSLHTDTLLVPSLLHTGPVKILQQFPSSTKTSQNPKLSPSHKLLLPPNSLKSNSVGDSLDAAELESQHNNMNRLRSLSDGHTIQRSAEEVDDSTLTRCGSQRVKINKSVASGVEQTIPTIRPSPASTEVHGKNERSMRLSQSADSQYVCRLNRSDSDSCMHKSRGSFTRGSYERRSLRYKQPVRSAMKNRLPITRLAHPP